MSNFWHRAALLATLVALSGASAIAKRVPPKPVAPVEEQGVRYTAEGDGRDQYVVATDIASGKELWERKVFHVHIKPWLGEEDNQWVFITDLKVTESSLLVRDEKARCYSIDLTTKHKKRLNCGANFDLP